MAIAIKALFSSLNLQVTCFRNTPMYYQRQMMHHGKRDICFHMEPSIHMRNVTLESSPRDCSRPSTEAGLLSPDLEEGSTSLSSFEDVTVTASGINCGDIKLSVGVSASKTEYIFDEVFSKLVATAQPIPGFRRVKGGETPDIPRDVLIQILGPSKVSMEVIKKIINTTVAEYAEKEGLKVAKDLKVEQSFEELEAAFEPGKEFSFDAHVRLLGKT